MICYISEGEILSFKKNRILNVFVSGGFMQKKVVLKFIDITKNYNVKAEEVRVLKNISLEFELGKFYAIMGKSGSGKSTLIKILGLIENPTDGKMYFKEDDVSKLDDVQKSDIRNKNIGFVFQDYLLDDNMTVLENIMLPSLIDKVNKNKMKHIEELMQRYGILNRSNHFPRQLSGGECQRVAICRALVNNPDIILADEPTGNLDVKNEIFVFQSLKEQAIKGKCVIVVSHSDKIKDYADKVFVLKDGKVGDLDYEI